MKNLYAAGFLLFLLFTAFTSFCQVEPPLNQEVPARPSLFASLPDKFECNVSQLQKLFSISPTTRLDVKLNNAFRLEGILAEKFVRSSQLTSINIRLNNYDDALFNVNRIETKDGLSYTGRIVSIRHGDILVLKKENGKYYLVKEQRQFSMVE